LVAGCRGLLRLERLQFHDNPVVKFLPMGEVLPVILKGGVHFSSGEATGAAKAVNLTGGPEGGASGNFRFILNQENTGLKIGQLSFGNSSCARLPPGARNP